MPIIGSVGIKSIQRGVASIASGTSSQVMGISTVVPGKTQVNFLGFGGSSGAAAHDTAIPRLRLSSATQVFAERVGTPLLTATFSYEVIEWY